MINLAAMTGPLAYVLVAIAAAVEGEVMFVAASVLVSQHVLSATGVVVAGAIGASAGDQFWFFVLRGRLRRWADRFTAVARGGRALVWRVQRHDVPMVLAIRFAPGMRIALAAACAYAEVPALRFSLLNAASSVVWAILLMVVVARAGPALLPAFGLSGWWAALVPAALIVILFKVLGSAERRVLDQQAPGDDAYR